MSDQRGESFHDQEFVDLLQGVRNQSPDAIRELVERYSSKILRVVRRKLPDALRRQYDSQDFVQQVWSSVLAHQSQLVKFESPQQFIAFIGGVAANKVKETHRSCRTQKRQVSRTTEFDDPLNGPPDSQRENPLAIAIAHEERKRLVEEKPERYQQIIEMRLAGKSVPEIASDLKMHRGHVYRILRSLRPQ